MSDNVVYLSEYRQKRDAERAKTGTAKEPTPFNTDTATAVADSITPEEGYGIAQDVVQQYSEPGALLTAFLKRRRSDSKKEELHEVLLRQRAMVGGYSTDELKVLFVLYKQDPDLYYETYILPAAEEYIRRFGADLREEAAR